MVQPFDYRTNVRTPFEMAMYGRGQALQQDIQQQALDAARAQEEARQKQIAATQQMQADFAKFAETKDKTAADYRAMMEKYPDLAANIDRSFQNLTNEQKQNRLNMALSVRGPLVRNKPDEAIKVLRMQADAARNSGFEQQAAQSEAMIESIKGSPEGSLDSINMTIAQVDPDLFKTLTAAEQQREMITMKTAEGQAKAKQEMLKASIEGGLKQAQALKVLKETEKLGIETQKAALELKRLEEQGPVDPKEKFNQEEKIRKEYQSRSKSLVEARDAYEKINISAKDKSGASDTALIFSFMKMLDPGSVVRESEFAQGQNVSGLMAKFENLLTKLKSGEFLRDEDRQKFVSLAKKYLDAGEKRNFKVRKDYDKLIKDFLLDPEHIFGEMTNAPEPPEPMVKGEGTGSRKLNVSEQQQAQKRVVKKWRNSKTGQIKVQYDDGTTEIL